MAICALQLAVFYSIYPSLSYITVILQFHRFGILMILMLLVLVNMLLFRNGGIYFLSCMGPLHAYILNTSKTYLVVKGK